MPSPKTRVTTTGNTSPSRTATEAMERSVIPTIFMSVTVYIHTV